MLLGRLGGGEETQAIAIALLEVSGMSKINSNEGHTTVGTSKWGFLLTTA